MSEELKPCPFCGGEATLDSGFDLSGEYWFVKCNNQACCAVELRPYWDDGRQRAIAAWNRRTHEPNTSVINWTRYTGHEDTRPDYDKDILFAKDGKVVMTTGGSLSPSNIPGFYKFDIGDLWAYLPTTEWM